MQQLDQVILGRGITRITSWLRTQAGNRLKGQTYTCAPTLHIHPSFYGISPSRDELEFCWSLNVSANKWNSAKAITDFHGATHLQRGQSSDTELI